MTAVEYQAPNGVWNELIKRDGLQCQSCGVKMRFKPRTLKRVGLKNEAMMRIHQVYVNHPERATLDHIIPRSQGGTRAISNLRLVCYFCNQWRADTPYLKRFEDISPRKRVSIESGEADAPLMTTDRR